MRGKAAMDGSAVVTTLQGVPIREGSLERLSRVAETCARCFCFTPCYLLPCGRQGVVVSDAVAELALTKESCVVTFGALKVQICYSTLCTIIATCAFAVST